MKIKSHYKVDIKGLEMEKALLEEHVRYGEARFRDKELVRPFVNRIYQDIAELEEAQLTRREWYQKGYNEAMKPKTCEDCKGFVRNDYCHIIDDDCRVVMERCNGCKQFEPKDTK